MKSTISAALALGLVAAPTLAAAQMTPLTAPPTPIPLPAPAPSVTPAPTASPAPTATPVTGPGVPSPGAASPSATPTVYRFTTMPSPAPNADAASPRIVEIDANDSTLHAPGPIMLRVVTSPNVVNVVARIMGHEVAIPRVDTGIFATSGQLPSVPFFLYGRHDVQFVAAAADGRTVSSTVTVSLAH